MNLYTFPFGTYFPLPKVDVKQTRQATEGPFMTPAKKEGKKAYMAAAVVVAVDEPFRISHLLAAAGSTAGGIAGAIE